MSFLKELFEAFKVRLRSPWMGSIILATLLWNWKGFAIMVFEKGLSITERVGRFEAEFQWYDLLVPVGIGFIFSLARPWINTGVDFLTSSPSQKLKLRNIKNLNEQKAAEIDGMEFDQLIDANERAEELSEKLGESDRRLEALQGEFDHMESEVKKKKGSLQHRDDTLLGMMVLALGNLKTSRLKDDKILDSLRVFELIFAIYESIESEGEKSIAKEQLDHNFLDAMDNYKAIHSNNLLPLAAYFTERDKMRHHRGATMSLMKYANCLLYTSPSPRDLSTSRMPSSA